MSEERSVGLIFIESLKEFSAKHASDDNVCGVKLDLRSQGYDLIVGIRFIDGESQFNLCTGNLNCHGIDEKAVDLLSEILRKIGVQSKSGADIMIKRNAHVVSTEEGCQAIEAVEESAVAEAPKKRSGLFGLFGN